MNKLTSHAKTFNVAEETNDYYVINYQTNFYTQFDNAAVKPQTRSFKIRKSDLQAKNWDINSPELENYIKSGLKLLVAFDFDLTLSNNHTWEFSFDDQRSSLKSEANTEKVLTELNACSDVYTFIATNNYAEKVESHLQMWNIRDEFHEIMDRETFHKTNHNKEYCFHLIYNQARPNRSVGINGFLDLNAPEKPIDFVGAYLIDDDTDPDFMAHMKHFGINVISVSKKVNDMTHLQTIDHALLNDSLKNEIKQNMSLMDLVIHTKDNDDLMCFSDGTEADYADGAMTTLYFDKTQECMGARNPLCVVNMILADLFNESCEQSYGKNRKAIVADFTKKVQQKGHVGQTLLHFICTTQDKDAITKLIESGADIHAQDIYGNAPLHLLVGRDSSRENKSLPSYALIDYLIQQNAPFELKNGDDMSFLHLLTTAIDGEDREQTLTMIAYIFANANLGTTLDEFFKECETLGVDSLNDGEKEKILKIYTDLKAGKELPFAVSNSMSLDTAWWIKTTEVSLLDLITMTRTTEDTILCPDGTELDFAEGGLGAFYSKAKECIGTKKVDEYVDNMLFGFIKNKKSDLAQLLREKVNQAGVLGQTLLHFICMTQDMGAIENLIDVGANIYAQDKFGNTPLHLLIGRDSYKENKTLPSYALIDFLIKISAPFELKNEDDFSFLHLLTCSTAGEDREQTLNMIAYIFANANLGTSLDDFFSECDELGIDSLDDEEKESIRKIYAELKASKEMKSNAAPSITDTFLRGSNGHNAGMWASSAVAQQPPTRTSPPDGSAYTAKRARFE